MKKAKSFLVCFLLILCCGIWLPKQVYAAGVTATLTGTSTVRAGDTITVTLKISGGNFEGVANAVVVDICGAAKSDITITGGKVYAKNHGNIYVNGSTITTADKT